MNNTLLKVLNNHQISSKPSKKDFEKSCIQQVFQSPLLSYTLEKLKSHIATRKIPERLSDPAYDEKKGEAICQLMLQLCHNDLAAYNLAIKDFTDFSEEFLRLQAELENTGQYHFTSYDEARKNIYDNPEVMERRYLNGLLLSQALWINQHKILSFFHAEFCPNNTKTGRVVEVPVGTGIFIAEFMLQNREWKAEGYDISSSAVNMSRKTIACLLPQNPILIEKRDVFDLQGQQQYDRIICGLLLENLEQPTLLLQKLEELLHSEGKIFLTASVWASTIDHLYLFKSVQEIKEMLQIYFNIEREAIFNVFPGRSANEEKTPINYACILNHKS